MFGSSDQWNGLGVFFDSFDNDNKRNNPYIMAMVNDGTKIYDHEKYVKGQTFSITVFKDSDSVISQSGYT